MAGEHLRKAREILARKKQKIADNLGPGPHPNGHATNGAGKATALTHPLYPPAAVPLRSTKKYERITAGQYVTDPSRLLEVIADIEASSKVGLDLETTGLKWWEDRIRLVSVTTESGKTWGIDAFEVDIRSLFGPLKEKLVVAHNALFDAAFLRRAGCELHRLGCTMLLSRMLTAGRPNMKHGLRDVLERSLKVSLLKEEQTSDWSGDLSRSQIAYAARDSKHLLELYNHQRGVIEALGMRAVADLEERFLPVVVEMSVTGMPVDPELWSEVIEEARLKKADLVARMDSFVASVELPEKWVRANEKNKDVPPERRNKVNWQSNDQVKWAFSSLGIEIPEDAQGKRSLGKHNRGRVSHPLAELIGEFYAIKNLPSTFEKAITERFHTGRIFPDWRQLEAGTGRMSCQNPPMHGVPKKGKLRRAIVAPEGYKIVGGDLSQIEVRVLAALSGDEVLREAYSDESNDVYLEVAKRVTGRDDLTPDSPERQICKAIVLGNMYGQGVEGMRMRIELQLGRAFSKEEALEYWSGFFDGYPGVKRWRERLEQEFYRGARETRTLLGRRRLNVENRRQRWNAPIQGTAADCIKAIACTIVRERARAELSDLKIFALVHDEVLCLVPEEQSERAVPWLKEIMETVGERAINGDAPEGSRVPVKADVKAMDNWGEKDD